MRRSECHRCPTCASRMTYDPMRMFHTCELCGRGVSRESLYRRSGSWLGRLWLRVFAA